MTNETTGNTTSPRPSATWIAVFSTEYIAILTINVFTIIVFTSSRHLRKRTTYLIISLTVADLLVGAVTGPMELYYYPESNPGTGFSWKDFCLLTLYNIFPVSSLANLSLIALERLHATLYPFRHCLIEKWAYYIIIFGCWLVALLFAIVMAVLYHYVKVAPRYVWISHIVLTLLILTISYVIIIVNVKSNPPPQPLGLLASDRKLSVTLFMVTIASVLSILPYAVYSFIPEGIYNQYDTTIQSHITYTFSTLYYASSVVNPFIYAVRMQEFRKSAKGLVCMKSPESSQNQQIELEAM